MVGWDFRNDNSVVVIGNGQHTEEVNDGVESRRIEVDNFSESYENDSTKPAGWLSNVTSIPPFNDCVVERGLMTVIVWSKIDVSPESDP